LKLVIDYKIYAVLISILSNTVARIDANANQEYLFQYAITTIEGVNSDALFSYQPPFNLLAFIILKPASCFLSPRALHSANVFLIKLTSFPTLIAIGVYERHFAAGQRLRKSSKDAAYSLYNILPRHIRNMMRPHSTNLYEAIFEVEISHEFELFDGSDDDLPGLHSFPSHGNMRDDTTEPTTPSMTRRASSRPRSLHVDLPSPRESPRTRKISALSPLAETFGSTEVPSLGAKSPLAKLFGPRHQTMSSTTTPLDEHPPSFPATSVAIQKMEALLEDMRNLPVQRLKDEMKELQDRQARIENLLLMLTRGMRNETGTSSRQGTMS